MSTRPVWNAYEPDVEEPFATLPGRLDIGDIVARLTPDLQARFTEPVIITVIHSNTGTVYAFRFIPEAPVE